jgi:pimeloyl-ACP methyl ester carboxylesterase
MNELLLRHGRVETAWWGPPPDRAPTLVLLHEGLGCVKLWRDFPAALQTKTGCGVFAYSRYGYGHSDPTALPRPLNYMHEEATDVLPEMLDRIGIQRAILVGHSDGGSIAAIYAGATQDTRLAGVVMMAAHFFVEDINIAAIQQIKVAYETGDLQSKLARYHHDVDCAFYGWTDAWLNPAFRSFDITGYLEAIRIPVLALQGADDPYGSDEQLHVLKNHTRRPIETRLISGARHSPHLESPSETLSAIAAFVREHLA